ncbi:MoaD/ThiS family protein [Desmospora profundinema]|uniref:Molybdopterin converting factor small subunit n=1 Tax=Desmospora profundinema TaxID=1571184 RepID=A0ABU1IMH7_9BACL|nr:MoaD/ThiS family protein [Desmospora profundinema]MDR6225987.1 molybdopterin converting factor small subunit [Desmospora profundinema]
MMVTFSANGQLRDALDTHELTLDLPMRASLTEATLFLSKRLDQETKKLLIEEEAIRKGILMVVNDEMVMDYHTPLHEGDRVNILMPMAGG